MPHELGDAVVPLIHHTALQGDEKLARFIRDNGGLAAFALAFKGTKEKKKGSSISKAVVAAGAILGM